METTIGEPNMLEVRNVSVEELTERSGLIDSLRAREYLQNLVEYFSRRLEEKTLSETDFQKTINAIGTLIPLKEPEGGVSIGGIRITERLRTFMDSRLNAHEIDVFSDQGCIGSLPIEVQEYVLSRSGFAIEFTDKCTVGCPFCDLAKKGGVQNKISLQSARRLMDIRADDTSGAAFSPYSGSDPFDAKWTEDGQEIWFGDLLEQYYAKARKDNKLQDVARVSLSTAIPVGEELSVLDGCIVTYSARNGFDYPRISRTRTNTRRAEAINTIMSLMFNTPIDLTEGPFTREQTAVISGKKWAHVGPDQYTMRDVLGVRCYDGTIISPHVVEGTIVMPQSPDYPNGSYRYKVAPITHANDPHLGTQMTRFEIPVHRDIYDDAPSTILDPTFQIFEYNQHGLSADYTAQLRNPHRSAFRLAAIIKEFDISKEGTGLVGRVSSFLRERLSGDHGKKSNSIVQDVQSVQEYLSGGNDNPVYNQILLRIYEIAGIK